MLLLLLLLFRRTPLAVVSLFPPTSPFLACFSIGSCYKDERRSRLVFFTLYWKI